LTTVVEPTIFAPGGRRVHAHRVASPVRVALAGAGFIADYHLEILREIPGVEVVGICDPNSARREQVADRWKIVTRTHSVEELLSQSKPDVVHVLVPPSLHYEVGKQLVECGIHVLLEKPMALSADDAKSLAEAAAAQGVQLSVNHNWLHQPLFQRALNDIANLRIGPVRHVVSTNSLPLFQLAAGMHDHWMFAAPTNVLFEQAPHPLSQICTLIGGISDIRAACGEPRALRGGRPFYPSWQFTIRGEHATAQMHMAFEGSFLDAQLHVIGQDGTIHIDQIKNCYTLDRRTTYVEPVDCFLRRMRHAREGVASACRQLGGYGLSLFKLAGRNDVYYLGMKGSITEFYSDLLHNRRTAGGLQNGLQTISALQQVVEHTKYVDSSPRTVPSRPTLASVDRREVLTGKVLVVGAAGFIGRHMVRRLADSGYDVRVMVRNPAKIADLVESVDCEVIRGDVEDPSAVDRAVAGCQAVINLVAGAPSTWDGHQRLFIDGVKNVADAVLRHGVERFLHTSSIAALYLGDPRTTATEATPTDGQFDQRCFYSKAKILGETLLDDMRANQGLPCAVFRPGLVVGPGSAPQHLGVGEWVSEVICVRWGRSLSKRLPFVLVDDVVEAYLCALKLDPSAIVGKKFNLVGDVQLSAQEYVDVLRSETARDFQVRPYSVAGWSFIESAKWTIKFLAGKSENVRLTWHELAYRTAASSLDCSETKRVLNWQPVADRTEFVERGIRAAVRAESST
jgi:predicted dehydrogenase